MPFQVCSVGVDAHVDPQVKSYFQSVIAREAVYADRGDPYPAF